jgi:hypothetical protein
MLEGELHSVSDPKWTTKLMYYYTLARDVRKQTERTVNVQCP